MLVIKNPQVNVDIQFLAKAARPFGYSQGRRGAPRIGTRMKLWSNAHQPDGGLEKRNPARRV